MKAKLLTYVIAVFLLILFATACDESSQSSENTNIQIGRKAASVTDNSLIIGKWSLCSESAGSLTTQYNVCSKLNFEIDGMGSKVLGNEFPEFFKWALKDGKLIITYDKTNNSKTFPDTNYSAIFNKDGQGIELTIKQVEKDYSYNLRRSP